MDNREYKAALRELAKSKTGDIILSYLKDAYVNGSTFHRDPYVNAYNTGKADLVKEMLFSIDQEESNQTIGVILDD